MGATLSHYWYGTEVVATESSPLAVTNTDAIKNSSETVTGTPNGTTETTH